MYTQRHFQDWADFVRCDTVDLKMSNKAKKTMLLRIGKRLRLTNRRFKFGLFAKAAGYPADKLKALEAEFELLMDQ